MRQKAEELFATKDYPGAARAYEELAEILNASNIPGVPYVIMQAGHSRILSGQTQLGMEHFKMGLSLLATQGEWVRFLRNRIRATNELRLLGLENEADIINSYFSEKVPAGMENVDLSVPIDDQKQERLPVKCQSCGAPLVENEVTWVDDVSAKCPYCGSINRKER
jgi:predicted RNA-binding Zn-ribbon protein involved in translation (DUF1610 family)